MKPNTPIKPPTTCDIKQFKAWSTARKKPTLKTMHIPVDEVPQVAEQFTVVLQQQVIPAKTGVLASDTMQSALRDDK